MCLAPTTLWTDRGDELTLGERLAPHSQQTPLARSRHKLVHLAAWNSTPVCVMHLEGREDLQVEPHELQAASKHPNVVEVFRIIEQVDPMGGLLCVLQHSGYGTLERLLTQASSQPLRGIVKLAIAEQICAAMTAMDAAGIMHGNLSTRNVLLHGLSPIHVKVADFGLASGHRTDSCALVPPEISLGLGLAVWTTQCDVWAFGTVMWEIFSDGLKVTPLQDAAQLPCPPGCPKHAHNIILRCCHEDPAQRPSFAYIQQLLRTWSRTYSDVPGRLRPASAHSDPLLRKLALHRSLADSRALKQQVSGASPPCSDSPSASSSALSQGKEAAERYPQPPSLSGAAPASSSQTLASAQASSSPSSFFSSLFYRLPPSGLLAPHTMSSSSGLQVQMALTVVLFALASLLLDLRQKDTGVSFSLLAAPIAFSWPYLAMLVWRMASREQLPSALFLTERGASWFPLLAIVARRILALVFVLGIWAMPAAYEIMIRTGLDVPIELLMVMVEGPDMRPNVVLFKLIIDLPVKMALFLRVGIEFAVIRAFASEMAAVCCWCLLHRRSVTAAKAT